MHKRKDRSYELLITGKAELCPGCKLSVFRASLPQRRSYTRQRSEQTTLKLCAQLRGYGRKVGVHCRHYPKGEGLDRFISRSRRKKRSWL